MLFLAAAIAAMPVFAGNPEYHTVVLEHTVEDGFEVQSGQSGSHLSTYVVNGAVQLIVRSLEALPPVEITYGADGGNLTMTANAPRVAGDPEKVHGWDCDSYPGFLVDLFLDGCYRLCPDYMVCLCEECEVVEEASSMDSLLTRRIGPTP